MTSPPRADGSRGYPIEARRKAGRPREIFRPFMCAPGLTLEPLAWMPVACIRVVLVHACLAFCRLLIFFSCRLTLTMHHISTKYMSVRSYGCVCLALSCVKLNTACPLSFSSFIVFPCTTTTLHSLFPRARPSKICLEPMDGSYSRADASRKQAPAGPGCPIFHFH